VKKNPQGRGNFFFADMDFWIKEESLMKSAIRPLLETWIEQGWLHVSPGKVFQPALFTDRLKQLYRGGCQFLYFGYDKYRAPDPINTLKACLQSEMGVDNPEKYVMPVSQLNSEFSGPTENLYDAMFAPVPFISFSNSPLWSWCFGNAVLEIDNRDNVRPVKRAQTDSCKVDPVQALVEAMDVYLRYEGSNH
jgi:phage terminase large subunit-like protein